MTPSEELRLKILWLRDTRPPDEYDKDIYSETFFDNLIALIEREKKAAVEEAFEKLREAWCAPDEDTPDMDKILNEMFPS